MGGRRRERPAGPSPTRRIADPEAGAGAAGPGAVARIGERTAVERQAAAADALGEAGAQALELRDALVDPCGPCAREARPVPPAGGAVRGQLLELGGDLVEREPDPLREHDEGDPAQDGPGVAAVPRALAGRADQAAVLVEAQRRGGDAAAPRHLADLQKLGHETERITSGA